MTLNNKITAVLVIFLASLFVLTSAKKTPSVPDEPTSHDYFPNGGKCSYRCNNDSDCQCSNERDCQKGGVSLCGKCGQEEGTQMYQHCYQPDDNEQPEDNERRLDSCGASCDSDNDCNQGGFITCGKCNLYQGTLGYKTCYNDQEEEPPTPAPTTHADYFPIGGSCQKECVSNVDCQSGGFNPCGKCGQVEGTEMYHVCYHPPNDEGRSLLRGSM